MKKIIFSLIFFSLTANALDQSTTQNKVVKNKKAPRKFPYGCREVGFTFENNHLLLSMIPEGQEQTLYLIHNRAPFDIAVKADTTSKFIPTYDKVLSAEQWLTFARDVKEVRFACFSQNGDALDCGETLEVCNYNNVKFPDTNLGTYWITNSGSQSEAIHGSIKKGILLRW